MPSRCSRARSPPTFRHRQTMANAMRFSTAELAETEGRIASATERALSLEQEVFAELAAAVQAEEHGLGQVAAALADLDATAALAELARIEGYTRPRVDDSQAFEIRGGRHPVVEQALKAAQRRTVHRERLRAGTRGRHAGGRRRRDGGRGASGSSPVRTWPASRRSCARTRSSP